MSTLHVHQKKHEQRTTRADSHLREFEDRHRSQFARFDDHRITRSERRGNLLDCYEKRVVEGLQVACWDGY